MTRYHKTIMLALGLLSLTARSVDAQEPQTFRACFVPQVGAMYLLDLPGLPTTCLSEGHEEITWSEGGPLPAGSVTSAKIATDAVDGTHIAAGAVNSAHIADGAITAADLAPGTIGGVEPGDINTEELADGAVTSAKIADGSIATADLSADAVTSAAIAPNTITALDIATDAVDSTHIAPNAVGASELNVRFERISRLYNVPGNTTTQFPIECLQGREVLSGGVVSELGDAVIRASYPLSESSWLISLFNPSQTGLMRFYALCADLG